MWLGKSTGESWHRSRKRACLSTKAQEALRFHCCISLSCLMAFFRSLSSITTPG